MLKVNVTDIKAHFSRYLSELTDGREDVVVVCRRNVPVAELRAVAVRSGARRPIGLAEGRFVVPKSFFDPLPEAVTDAFEGRAK